MGLATAVALGGGARVLATDYYEAALEFARHNARENTGREPETAHLDWRDPEVTGRFDLVFAADVLYEEQGARSLARLVPGLLDPAGEAVFADPGRRYEPLFRELMLEQSFRFDTGEVRVGVEGLERQARLVVHRIRRRAAGT